MRFLQLNIILTLSLSLLVTGCTANKSTPKPPVNKSSVEEIYKIIALSKSDYGKNGSPCADAVGVIKIYNKSMTGTATDSIGRRFHISGEQLGDRVSGSFLLAKKVVIKYTGTINKSGRASGTWKDTFQCNGSWTAKRVFTRKHRKGSRNIKT